MSSSTAPALSSRPLPPLCHPEERSDEGSAPPKFEGLEQILRCAQDDKGEGDTLLRLPLSDEPREIGQDSPLAWQVTRGFDRLVDFFAQHSAGAVDTPDGGERRLAGGRVLARGLAERRGVRLEVEEVVLDLEGQADRAAIGVQAREILVFGEGEEAADGEGGADQAAGFALMDLSTSASDGLSSLSASRSATCPPIIPVVPMASTTALMALIFGSV